jgi:hypothetical protein
VCVILQQLLETGNVMASKKKDDDEQGEEETMADDAGGNETQFQSDLQARQAKVNQLVASYANPAVRAR